MRIAGLTGLFVLLLGALLRLLWIDAGWFGVDQARDLAWAEAIASGDGFPLVGPLMRGRVHLGAAYYYFWSIPGLFGSDPRIAYAFAALLGVAAVTATYALARSSGGPRAGGLAALLLATTPAAVIDSRIAWAPAALPPLTAAVLLLGRGLLRRPSSGRAAAVAASATFATQLHLAAAPLAVVAAGCVLARHRVLGARALLVAAVAGALPLVPMALAFQLTAGERGEMRGDVLEASGAAATRSADTSAGDPRRGRVSDILSLGSRIIAGYTPPAAERAWWISAWSRIEVLAVPFALLGALATAIGGVGRAREARAGGDTPPWLELATFLLCLAAVLGLPAEAWYYYLDTALVPGCVLLGFAATRPGRAARLLLLALLAATALRVVGLLLWIGENHASGLMRVNLELLRVGGADAGALEGRARLPTLAVKQAAASALVADLGIPSADLRSRAHGPAFADLDTDNGFFFERAAPDRRADPPIAAPEGVHALVLYADELPDEWTAATALRTGPLEIVPYVPQLRVAAARIEGCGDRPLPLPKARPTDPREYGFGEPALPTWPCAPGDLEVHVPIDPTGQGSVRVFARATGAARVLALESAPPGGTVEGTASGMGAGLLLPPDASELRLRVRIDGPAALDLYELQGADTSSRSAAPPR